MTITYVGTNFASGGSDTDTGGQAVSIGPPSGTVGGDLLIFMIWPSAGDDFALLTPSGWTLRWFGFDGTYIRALVYRVADGSPADSFSGTTQKGNWWVAAVSAWQGVNTADPFRDQFVGLGTEISDGHGGLNTQPFLPYLIADDSSPTVVVYGEGAAVSLTSVGSTTLTLHDSASVGDASGNGVHGAALSVWSATIGAATVNATENTVLNYSSTFPVIGGRSGGITCAALLLFDAAKPASSWNYGKTQDWFGGVPIIESDASTLIDGNTANGQQGVFVINTPAHADYFIQADFKLADTDFWSVQIFELFARAQNPFTTNVWLDSYSVRLQYTGGEWSLHLYKWTGGGQTDLATAVTLTIAPEVTVSVSLQVSGPLLTVKYNDTATMSATDTSFSSAGRIGKWMQFLGGGAATGSIDNVIGKYV